MKDNKASSTTQPEQAIQKVLQAEQDAEHAIQDCENQAQQLIQKARASAQRILARTDQRITNMEMRHEHKLNQLIKEIEQQGTVELRQDASRQADMKKLQYIAEELATDLCRADELPGHDIKSGK